MDIIFSLPPALLIGLIVSTFLPLLVGLVTKIVTAPGARAILLAILSALTGLLTELLTAVNAGTAYDLGVGLLLAFAAFVVAVMLHYGIYKPTGVSAAAIAIGSKPRHSA